MGGNGPRSRALPSQTWLMTRAITIVSRSHLRRFVVVAALVFAGALASAIPAKDYLALRRRMGYRPGLAYAKLAQDWTPYEGAVLELSGVLNGHIRGDRAVTFMLTLPTGEAVSLAAPEADAKVVTEAPYTSLRVLVRVKGGVVGNVVPLEAIAIADDAEIRYRERVASEAQARTQAAREAASRRSSSRSMSAGGGVRLRPMGGALSGLSDLARRYLSPEAQSVYPRYCAFIANHNKRLGKDDVDAIAVSILYFAQRHRVDPRLIVALIIAESDFDPNSTSHKGAMGLGQVMPDEARAFRLSNPYDPIQNVRASVNMLRMKLDMYRERGTPDGQMTLRQISLAMAAYNAGAGAVKKHGGIPPYRETQRYVARVLSLYKTLCGG